MYDFITLVTWQLQVATLQLSRRFVKNPCCAVNRNKYLFENNRGKTMQRGSLAGVSNTGGARYRVNRLPGPREPFKRDTMDLAPEAIEGAGGVLSQ